MRTAGRPGTNPPRAFGGLLGPSGLLARVLAWALFALCALWRRLSEAHAADPGLDRGFAAGPAGGLEGSAERRSLAAEGLVLGPFGALLGKRRALEFAGGERCAVGLGRRSFAGARLEVARRRRRRRAEPGGRFAPELSLYAVVTRTPADGEVLLWRVAEVGGEIGAGGPGSRLARGRTHASREAALCDYLPAP